MVPLTGLTYASIRAALNWLEKKTSVRPIPGMLSTDRSELIRYLRPIHREAQKVSFNACQYPNGLAPAAASESYIGGVYSPTQNRIYLIPSGQAPEANWHFINCETGAIDTYANGVAPAAQFYAYSGGAYSPTQNRIYMAPSSNGPLANWHYIDCSTGDVVEFANGIAPACQAWAYTGAVYSPTQNRIYLMPSGQANQANWHYVDCDTGAIVEYPTGLATPVDAYGYFGGVYSPTQNRIYLVPRTQANNSVWHYIDCDTGTVEEYLHGATAVNSAYNGGVYSPTQNRIYFVPASQAPEAAWHYINCDDGSVVEYPNDIVPACQANAYSCGIYSPAENRIYFSPRGQAAEANWHYVDCDDGSVIEYANGLSTPAQVNAYYGGVYSPTENRIYFSPNIQGPQSDWHYLQEYSDVSVSRNLMAGPLFNKL